MIISNIPQPVADAVYDIIREKLAAGIPLRSRVASRSMVPLIVPGDVVSVHSSVPDALRKGDIVAVRAGNQIVVHRFRGRTRQGGRQMLLVKSDRALSCDPPLEKHALLGVISSIERNGRTLELHTVKGRLFDSACRMRTFAGLLFGRFKHWARRIVIATASWPGLRAVYRLYYYSVAVLVRFVLVHGFSVKALWLRRSFATGEWEPGRSDIDFGICITAAEPVTEPRVYTRVARCLEWMKKFIWVISEIESYTAADLAIERKFGEKGREALNWKFLHGRAADFPDYQFHPLKYKIDASLELLVVLLMFGRTLTLQARPNQPDIYLSRRFVKALWDILRWSAVIGEDFGFETNTPLTRAQLQQFLHRLPHEHFLRAQAAQLAELDGSDAGLIGKHYAYLIDHLSRSAEALNVQLRSAGLKNQVWERNPAAACTVGQTACCLRTGFYAELDFYELTSPLDGGFFADFVASRHAGGNSAVICTSSLSELLSLSLPDNAASYFASSPVDTELARLFLFQQAALQLRALSRISSAAQRSPATEALLCATTMDSLKLLLAWKTRQHYWEHERTIAASVDSLPGVTPGLKQYLRELDTQSAGVSPASPAALNRWLVVVYPWFAVQLRSICAEVLPPS